MAGYIEESVKRAAEDDSPAMIVTLNTPGGSLDATQRIVSALLEAPLPTIVWVAPEWRSCAPAPAPSSPWPRHLAYMAPGHEHRGGLAGRLGWRGPRPGTIGEKVSNDAMANIRSIAESTRPERRLGGLHRRQGRLLVGRRRRSRSAPWTGSRISLEDVRRQADGQVVEVNSAAGHGGYRRRAVRGPRR